MNYFYCYERYMCVRACVREYCVCGLLERTKVGGKEGLKACEEGCMQCKGVQGGTIEGCFQ